MGNRIIGQLDPKSAPANGDLFVLEDSEDTKKIDYNSLADAILNKLTAKTYAVSGSNKTLIAGINELYGRLVNGVSSFQIYTGLFSSVSPGKISDVVTLQTGAMRMIAIFYYNGYIFQEAASFYFIQKGADGGFYGLQTICKGTSGMTVDLSSDGTITKGAVNNYNVRCIILQLTI